MSESSDPSNAGRANTMNAVAAAICDQVEYDAESMRVGVLKVDGARVLDFGLQSAGGMRAGLALAAICLGGRGRVQIDTASATDPWPAVTVATDEPVRACLLSQYAGWKIAEGKFFAMGSGPMRAVLAEEPLFAEAEYREPRGLAVGVLESSTLPTAAVVQSLAMRLGVPRSRLTLCIAPTASLAGSVQIAARGVETALHKLHELAYPVRQVKSAFGTVPLPPVAKNDLAAIGRTNDAILYGGTVHLWVDDPEDQIAEAGPRVPSSSSRDYGRPFVELFERSGRDFYKIDPLLFSPARVIVNNLATGSVRAFGELRANLVAESFGL